ncbi:proton-conducting transporter transmembrane domain-containing protein [Limobrevibacterium gyesilva]|uniref:Proton-conducting transporter membrane subunit n=1 Tax=Limobrevibacterium gyesilva TaxID=2991712 RepID=A0AA41YHV3_9PROT|nr:proton-conducting transporter membrane subunit [Limobrevibacterium gyesilva]MCW3473721.1 proton-conducting transporter membrane subunit [Limobrevibacterium gyesilva]
MTLPGLALGGFALFVAALLLVGAAAVARPRFAALGALPLCAAGALLALAYLIGGAHPAAIAVPIGPPGVAMTLAIDGLSGFFLLLLLLAGAAASATALDDHQGEYAATAPFFPVFLGAMALTLLAADAFALVIGFELMSLASFALVLTHHRDEAVRTAALLYIGMAAIGAACLIPALALIAQAAPDLRFATLRAHPPEGWRAVAVLALVLVGAGSKAGLAPLHVWLPPAHSAAPGHVSALMSGAMTKVALYVLIRVLFDLCGPAQPMWWGLPLVLLGAAGAVLGGLRANMEGDIKAVLACSTVENIGLIAIGLGLALAARAVDLGQLAALAMAGALLHAMAHGMFKPLLFLCAGATQHGAGTRRLDRLGGLIHRMPVTTACVLVGGACLAGLPPSSGFAGEWTLFQAVLGAPRIGGIFLQTVISVTALLMALAVALAAAATVRLIGVAFLGRPRSPRAAAAVEAGLPARAGMIGLAAVSGLIGLFPGAVLALAGPAQHLLVGAAMEGRAGGLVIAPQADAPGYAAPAIAALLGLCGVLVAMAVRRYALANGAAGHRRGPAWDGGFGAAPAWLPFGDPLTQYGGASFAQPLRRSLGTTLLAARESVFMPEPGDTRPARLEVALHDPADTHLFQPAARARDALSGLADRMQFLTIRRTLSLMFIALVLFLAVVAAMEQM